MMEQIGTCFIKYPENRHRYVIELTKPVLINMTSPTPDNHTVTDCQSLPATVAQRTVD